MGNGRRQFLCWMLTVTLAGCQKLNLRSQNPDEDDIKLPETRFIRDQVTVSGLHPITIESVGLVTNLDNTGGDPPPSMYRSLLVNDMKKRGISNPHTLLQSPTSALVLIRAAVPPVIDVGDRFDVEVVLPENGEATSLKGGWLLEAYLSEQAMVPGGQPHPGHALAKAQGPVMLSTGEGDSDSTASVLKRGRILGGGKYVGGLTRKGRALGLYVRSDLRSVRTTRKIADHIGKRFHYHEKGIKKPLATAKTDQHIELRVHPRYKENYIRYIHVIRNIALDETGPERKERIERLRKSLMVPQTAMQSATELEAIGPDAIVVLKEGITSPDPEVRYYSADALAYLGDGAGTQILADAARREPAFRVFALTALTTLGTPEARECLIDLMVKPGQETVDGLEQEVSSAETRYGAFRALWTLDKHDEFISGENMNDEFKLHVIPADGEPMVHLTRYRVPEVVVFGKDQRLSTPINLTAGRHIMITAPSGSDTVLVSRLHANDDADQEVVTTTRIADIIRAVGKMRAAYPDVAQMLVQAEKQSSLPGRLEIDALPQAGRIYYRTAGAPRGNAGQEVKVGNPSAAPNMFPTPEPTREARRRPFHTTADEASEGDNDRGEASLADVRDGEEEPPAKKRAGGFFGLFRSSNDSQ
jgi:flagellar basal body P-ring protein FlgI